MEAGARLLDARDVLVIDEAGMIGSRQMGRLLSAAEKTGANVALVGDPVGQVDQHRAIERHARAAVDVVRMDERGLPVLAHQRRALEEARQALAKIGPHAAKDLERTCP